MNTNIGVVKKMIINPNTGKRVKEVLLWYDNETAEIFRWNSAYHVYNSVSNYEQLYQSQVRYIVFPLQ